MENVTETTERYYNPETDDKYPTWLKVVILLATAALAVMVWAAC